MIDDTTTRWTTGPWQDILFGPTEDWDAYQEEFKERDGATTSLAIASLVIGKI